MAKKWMTLAEVAEAKGGLISRMFAAQMNRAALDLESAPDVPEPRITQLTVKQKPVIEDGDLADVITEITVSGRQPPRTTSFRTRVGKMSNGQKQLYFEEDAPDNPDQMSLLDQERVKPC